MSTQDSTPPDSCNFDPVADAMLRAVLTTQAERTARAEFEERTKRHAAELEARKRQNEAEVVARWRASLVERFHPKEDFGDFTTWKSTRPVEGHNEILVGGFDRYCGDPWARRTEAGWLYEQARSAHTREAFAPDERQIIERTFDEDEWATPARRWVLLEDKRTPAPIDLPTCDYLDPARWKARAADFAAAYRAALPEPMRALGIVIGLRAGKPLHVAVWLGDEPRTNEQIEKWLRAFDDAEKSRFEGVHAEPPRLDWLALEPVQAQVAPTLDALRTPLRVAGGGGVVPTGTPLDKLFRLGGTSVGLHVILAFDKNCKTLTLEQIAEHRTTELKRQGAWLAIDEPAASIQKRRWQYRGFTETVAMAKVERGEVVQDGLAVVDMLAMSLDAALARVTELVRAGLAFDLYVDSINSEAIGTADIDALVRKLKATGATIFVTAAAIDGSDGRPHVKGSRQVRFEADATVELRYSAGEELRMRVQRARTADDGEVATGVDTARQRFVALGTVAGGTLGTPAPDDAVTDVLAVLAAAEGPLGSAQLTTRIPRRKTEVLAALKRAIETGKVVRDGGKYRVGT